MDNLHHNERISANHIQKRMVKVNRVKYVFNDYRNLISFRVGRVDPLFLAISPIGPQRINSY
jgi:hypothetical protein